MAKSKVQEQQKQPSKFKQAVTNYKAQLQEAYSVGYNHGLEARDFLPNKVGAISAATAGFKGGLKDKKKLDKIEKRKGSVPEQRAPVKRTYNRWGKRQ